MKVNCLFFIILLGILLLHVEGISLLQLKSPTESQGNEKEHEGFSTQALPDNLRQQDDAIPPAGGEEDTKLPEIDPASNEQPGSDGSAPGSDDLQREKRSPKFHPLPNGDLCLLSESSGEVFYDYTNAAGLQCQCELCFPGHILERNCTCDRSTVDMLQRSECRLVAQGKQYMPVHNKCTTGIDCKACSYPWIVKTECPATSDTECKCGSEGYSVNENDCIPKPRCDVDHEPRFGEKYNIMVCQRCEEGYSQPKSNSTDKCLKIPDPTEHGTPTTTDATGTSDKPTLVTGDVIHCLTWEIGIIVGVSILVSFLIGIGATCLYIKKYYDLTPKGAKDSKDDRSSMPLERVVSVPAEQGDNHNSAGDNGHPSEPTVTSPMNPSPDGKKGSTTFKQKGSKRARKRAGKHNSL